MKIYVPIILGVAVISLLSGCSTTPVALAPVGPNPASFTAATGNGRLEVFSALTPRMEGTNPTWYQHTDYYVCHPQGQRLQHIANYTGYYALAPRVITLPPGQYLVEARAKNILQVKVPVVIKSGEITRVHLDGNWQPGSGMPKAELVYAPTGYPAGWSAGEPGENRVN
jgi:hypothetical protein